MLRSDFIRKCFFSFARSRRGERRGKLAVETFSLFVVLAPGMVVAVKIH